MKRSAQRGLWSALKPISKLLAYGAIAVSLQSCLGMQTAPSPVAKVSAPEQCLAPPSPLPLLTDTTLEGVLRHLILVANQWWELKGKHECLAEFDRLR